MNEQPTGNKGLIFGIIGITVLIFAGLVWAIVSAPPAENGNGGTTNESVSFNDANDPVKGKVGAAVVVHLYSDFQCPACRASEPAVRYAMEKYGDRVLFIWKDFPLLQIHKNARKAANAARCAQDEGKFWEYHDKLYDTQSEWSNGDASPKFLAFAGQLGLNSAQFTSCLNADADDAKVAAGIAEGYRNQIDRTPTVFINNRRYFSMTPAEWDAALESALSSIPAAANATETTPIPSATSSGS